MTSRLLLLTVSALGLISPAMAHAATIAVMPVRGINLTEGQCDAIGELFATAFAHDARVTVASPAETKPVRAQLQTSQATAAQLGVSGYVEVTSIRLANRVTLAGVLFGKDGSELYRAETSAARLETMDTAAARLAHALVWRQPIAPSSTYAAPEALEAQPAGDETPAPPSPSGRDPLVSSTAFGLKGGFSVPVSSGRSFSTVMSLQFDGRIGPRSHFVEIGAGMFIPTEDQYGTSGIRATSGFLDLGAGFYLSPGNTALYLAGGVSPGFWESSVGEVSHTVMTCSVFGQLGATFTRDSRARFSLEVRAAQYLLGISDPILDSSGYGSSGTSGNYRPVLLSMLAGVLW
jgi:hypothetical protein